MTYLRKTKDDRIFMIYTIFYSNCTISPKRNSRIICRETKMCPLDIIFLHTFLYRISTKGRKNYFLHEILTRKIWKHILRLRFKPNIRKTAYTEKKHIDYRRRTFFKKHSKFFTKTRMF